MSIQNKTIQYTMQNIGTGSQNYTVENFKNGRISINGNYFKLTAADGQVDDLIINGQNNQIFTKDGDDLVRIISYIRK